MSINYSVRSSEKPEEFVVFMNSKGTYCVRLEWNTNIEEVESSHETTDEEGNESTVTTTEYSYDMYYLDCYINDYRDACNKMIGLRYSESKESQLCREAIASGSVSDDFTEYNNFCTSVLSAVKSAFNV